MEFVKAYNVTNFMDENIDKLLNYKEIGFDYVYVVKGILDMYVYRVIKGYNVDFEKQDGMYVVEYVTISQQDLVEKLYEMGECSSRLLKEKVDDILKECGIESIILATLLLDDEKGAENWNRTGCRSLDEVKLLIGRGYGVIDNWR